MATIGTDGYALLATINLPGTQGGHGDWVAYDAATGYVWLAQSPDNNVVVIDSKTNTIKATIPNVGNANGIALSDKYAFVANVTDNTTDVIDKATFQVVAKVAQTGTTPDSVTYISGTNQVAVASDDNNVEDFINATAPFTQTASVALTPVAAVSGPDVSTYVASKGLIYQPVDGQVDVLNAATGALVTTWPLLTTGFVKPGVYDPNTDRFFFGTTNKQVLVVDATSGALLKTIAITGSVDELSIDVATRRAFVGDKAGVVDVVNLDTQTLVGGLPAEKNMHTLAVNTANHYVYVYENNRNTVDVYAPVPGAPATGTPTAIQALAATLQATILAGTNVIRAPNADGSVPTVAAGTGGVVLDANGGQAVVLAPSYVGAYLQGTGADTVFGGGAGQTIISGTAGSQLIMNGGKNAIAAAGNNVIFDNNDTDTIILDSGNNTVVENGATTAINGSTGQNLYSINAGTSGATGTVLINSIGQDTILLNAGVAAIDASSSSATSTQLVGVFGGRLSFVGGAGSATVLGGTAGGAYVRGGSGTLLASGTTAGNNLLVGGTGQSTLFGGGNGDVLVAGLGATQLVAGAGNETLTGAFTGYATSSNNVFFTGAGTASITTGNGNDTVFAGSGTSTVNIGPGKDVIAIASGRAGGSVTITGFLTTQDRITLQGYGPNAAANAVTNATGNNGLPNQPGATLTLTDGTKITFAGVTNLTTSSFI